MSLPEPTEPPGRDLPRMTLGRASWCLTGAAFFIAGVVLLIEGYLGYAIVTLVISAAAVLNLF